MHYGGITTTFDAAPLSAAGADSSSNLFGSFGKCSKTCKTLSASFLRPGHSLTSLLSGQIIKGSLVISELIRSDSWRQPVLRLRLSSAESLRYVPARDRRLCCAGCIRLTGSFPSGRFLFEHILISNSTAISGPEAYARQVSFLANLPLVFFLELFGIWIPIAVPRALWLLHLVSRRRRIRSYPWTGNWMYTLQRWTGGIAFIYIVWHTYTMRFSGIDLHDNPAASFGKVQAEVLNPWLLLFYVVGLIAASWHFAYGIWLFCAKWGIVVGEKAQKRLLGLCLAFFLF